MSGKDELPRPRLDDQFWFDLSQTYVKGATASRRVAAGALQKMIVWLWSVYTASAMIGVALSRQAYPSWVYVVAASPVIPFMVGYWFAGRASFPVPVEFDARIPKDIERAYMQDVATRSTYFTIATGWAGAGALLLSATIVLFALMRIEAQAVVEAFVEPSLQNVGIVIHLPSGTQGVIRVKGDSGPPPQSSLKSVPFVVGSSGTYTELLAFGVQLTRAEVAIDWIDMEGTAHSYKRFVSPTKP